MAKKKGGGAAKADAPETPAEPTAEDSQKWQATRETFVAGDAAAGR